MARIRTIKPGFFTSEDVAALSLRARYTWIGLWTQVDDAGRMKANPRVIKGALYPLDDDVSAACISADLRELKRKGRIELYTVDGTDYLAVTNWRAHQRIDKPSPSSLPANPDSVSTPGILPEPSTGEGKGREGERKGGAAPAVARPSPHCAKHPNGTTKPCRACGDARRAHDAWREIVPGLPTVDEALNPELCPHEFRRGACPTCRKERP